MKVSLVVPVFNEQDVIPIFYEKVRSVLSEYTVEIVFIDDGSTCLLYTSDAADE